jgi:glucose-1-phosphate adenylyltransferase
MNKPNWIAMLLAGGRGTRLNLLTKTIVKPAVPFGGKYRIIDFALSNCKNSGIETVGILTQYKPLVLHSHIGQCNQWKLADRYGGLIILPPYQRDGSGVEWYEGTAHAVYQNFQFIEQHNPDYVLILSADQVYKMDYREMLQHHIETNADCTIAVIEVPWESAHQFGVLEIDKRSNKILAFNEKPQKPTTNLISMGIYIFNWAVLKDTLIKEEQKEFTHRDFGKDIIPSMLDEGFHLSSFLFQGYWRDVGTIRSFWEANLDLLNIETNIFQQAPEWKIYSVENNEPPSFIDGNAKVHHSLISDGCEISGSVERAVIFNGVKIGKGAHIKNSVILPHTVIEENVWLENSVVGSQSLIKKGVIIGSKIPEEYIIVVGNQVTVDPAIEEVQFKNSVKSVLS